MPSKSKAQARFMAACAHGAGYDSCPPLKVAKEFNRADKGGKLLRRAAGGAVPAAKSIMRVIQRAAQKYPEGSTEDLLTRNYDRHALVSARPQPTPAQYLSDREIWNTMGMNPRNVYSLDADHRKFVDAALSDLMEMGVHPSWIQSPRGYIATRPQAGFGHASYFPNQSIIGGPGLVGVDENILNTAIALSRKDPRAAQTVRGFLMHELGHSVDKVQSPFQLTGNRGPLKYDGPFFDPRIEFEDGAMPTQRWYSALGSVMQEIDAARYLKDGNPRPRRGPMAQMLDYPLRAWPPQYRPPFLTSDTPPDLGPSEILAQLLRMNLGNLPALTPKARTFVEGLHGMPYVEARGELAKRMQGLAAGGRVKGGLDAAIAWLNRQFAHPPKSLRTTAVMVEPATTNPSYGREAPGISWGQQVDEAVPVVEEARRYLSPESKHLLGEMGEPQRGVWLGSEGVEHNPVFAIPIKGRLPTVRTRSVSSALAQLGAMLGQDGVGAIRAHPSLFRKPSPRSNAAIIQGMSDPDMRQLAQFWGNRDLGTMADRPGGTIAFPFSGDPHDADKMFADLKSRGIEFWPAIADDADRTFVGRAFGDTLYEDALDAADIDRVTAGRIAAETARLAAGRRKK